MEVLDLTVVLLTLNICLAYGIIADTIVWICKI